MPPQMMNRGKPIPAGVRPPPGARGEVPAAETGSKGMGGGIMAMILPVYAIGIVIYLLYTASKVSFQLKCFVDHKKIYSPRCG